LEKVEQEMRENADNGKVDKQIVDLNVDGKEDVIYSSAFGDMFHIRVFLQIEGQFVEKINTGCTYYTVDSSSVRSLQLIETCCGESPFTSHRMFVFNDTSAYLVVNYIITNGGYTEDKITIPSIFLGEPYSVIVLNNNYNLRFSPDMNAFESSNEDNYMFTCQANTNIIATLKIQSRLKVLAKVTNGDRIWLYVEAGEEAIANKCRITDFDALTPFSLQHPSIIGWVSSRYTKKE
jgi:hypothetical protein